MGWGWRMRDSARSSRKGCVSGPFEAVAAKKTTHPFLSGSLGLSAAFCRAFSLPLPTEGGAHG